MNRPAPPSLAATPPRKRQNRPGGCRPGILGEGYNGELGQSRTYVTLSQHSRLPHESPCAAFARRYAAEKATKQTRGMPAGNSGRRL
ncbi:hypothetical protein [Mobiluncus mulieris]|uniref:hypothetical protein n=1 Tax=Mobiluncus mulieris TaxID=2052 RepID=UPI0021E1DEFB|nr:hypothetical protein [Mobiluncus mulieris]